MPSIQCWVCSTTVGDGKTVKLAGEVMNHYQWYGSVNLVNSICEATARVRGFDTDAVQESPGRRFRRSHLEQLKDFFQMIQTKSD